MESKAFARVVLAITLMISLPAVDGFLRHLCFNPLGFARIDPIVNFGQPAAHVHHLHGGNNLGLDSIDAEYLLQSNCTSCSITVDKSAYWAPAMYFQHANGTLSLLSTASAITIYYKLEKRADYLDRNYTVFPRGFRMVAGTNAKRTWTGPWPVPPQSRWGPNDTTQAALAEKALGFNCLNYAIHSNEASLAYPYIRDKTFTDARCIHGIRAELLFPSCWDGVSLDSDDHKSHVVYPTLIQDGDCPDTHPVFLPILFYETIWNTQEYATVEGRYIMSNGDPTGYGYHGDFISAWEDGVLQQIMDDPTCTDHVITNRTTDGIQEHCKAIASSLQSPEVAAQCKLQVPEVLQAEDIKGPLAMLPNGLEITGVRHDPGEHIADEVAHSSQLSDAELATSSASKSAVSPATFGSSPVCTSPVSTKAVASLSPALSVMAVSTSTYVTGGTFVELIIVQQIITETVVVESTQVSRVRPKHAHMHLA